MAPGWWVHGFSRAGLGCWWVGPGLRNLACASLLVGGLGTVITGWRSVVVTVLISTSQWVAWLCSLQSHFLSSRSLVLHFLYKKHFFLRALNSLRVYCFLFKSFKQAFLCFSYEWLFSTPSFNLTFYVFTEDFLNNSLVRCILGLPW